MSQVRTCQKCGGTDIFVEWHEASPDPIYRTCGQHRSCLDKFPVSTEEHLHLTCRTCSYEWITAIREDKMDQQRRDIAQVCHEVNRAYCESLGDFSQFPWDDAPGWQRDSAINGVAFHFDNPDAAPDASHQNWYSQKEREGWRYGPVKDPQKKEHPCMVPFKNLPAEQQVKDILFACTVKALCRIPNFIIE